MSRIPEQSGLQTEIPFLRKTRGHSLVQGSPNVGSPGVQAPALCKWGGNGMCLRGKTRVKKSHLQQHRECVFSPRYTTRFNKTKMSDPACQGGETLLCHPELRDVEEMTQVSKCQVPSGRCQPWGRWCVPATSELTEQGGQMANGERETFAACFLFGDGCSPSGGERLRWEADALFEEQH